VRVKWTIGAREDLVELVRVIAEDNPPAARRTSMKLRARSRDLSRFPEMGRMVPEIKDEMIRELVTPPYRLIYRVGPDVLEVLAVVHSRQDLMTTRAFSEP